MRKLFLFCTLFAVAFMGCVQFEEPTKEFPAPDETVATAATSPQTRAGLTTFETLDNPYDLALMRQLTGNPSLQPTHLYVRFLPADSAQLNTLEDDLSLDLFDYPLDVNIEDDEVYVDPTIPEGEFTWQYTAVPANFSFPSGIRKEILQQCYIPADDEEVPLATRAGEPNLERAAILACGYTLDPETRANDDKKPDGKVEVVDNSGGTSRNVPVKGVRVKCHYFIKSGRAYTDHAGRYSIDRKFYVKPYYSVVYRNVKDFVVWDGLGHRAKAHKGRYGADGHDIIIRDWLSGWTWAVINNAAYDYYEMCRTTGIAEPPSGLKIWEWPNQDWSSAPMMRRLAKEGLYFTSGKWATFIGAGVQTFIPDLTGLESLLKFLEPDLIIGTKEADYRGIYESVNHELSHASHFKKVGSGYWYKYVGYIINCAMSGQDTYGNGTLSNYGYAQVGEMWGYAMGHIQEHDNFQPATNIPYPYVIQEGDWIHPDPIWALITRGILTKKQIFDSMTSDVDTVDKWINKLCSGKTTEVAAAIQAAFAHNDVPVIAGTPPSSLNTNATFSVPTEANLSDDYTFDGWTVSPNSGYTTTGGLAGRTLTLKFTAYGTYTLTANFTLPDGSDYPATKTVTLSPPASPAPVIICTVPNPPTSATFTVKNPNPAENYEWEINRTLYRAKRQDLSSVVIIDDMGNITFRGNNLYTREISGAEIVPCQTANNLTVRCRAITNDVTTAWSNTLTTTIWKE